MAKGFSSSHVVGVTDVNGTRRVITAFVDDITPVGRSFAALDVTAFGDTAEKFIRGIEQAQAVTIRGHFDDTGSSAGGPDDVFTGLVGGTGTGTLDYSPLGTASGARKVTILFVHGGDYKITGRVKERISYEYTLRQTGTGIMGTN